jgi:hypothetical protein
MKCSSIVLKWMFKKCWMDWKGLGWSPMPEYDTSIAEPLGTTIRDSV